MGFLIRRQQKPRQFNLKPRYYDERKEKLEKLKAKHEHDGDFDARREAFREELHDAWSSRRLSSDSGPRIRILVIFALLLTVAFLFLYK